MNWNFSLFRTGFLLQVQPAKINFEIDFCRLKIQFFQLDFSNLIFQKSSTDQHLKAEQFARLHFFNDKIGQNTKGHF